ncbi:hypothetical protein Tco_0304242 [Tanacetum coccineum]
MNDYEASTGIQEDSDSDLQSMPDDDLISVSEFKAVDSDDTHDNEVSHSAHTSHDAISSAERLSLPDHMDHICEEVSSLHSRLKDMESSILPGILSATLKDYLPLIINESLQTHNLAASKQFAETQTQLNKKVVKQLNRQFNISHVAQSNRFVTLKKELSKVIKSEVAKKLQDVKYLLKSAVIIDETAKGEKKQKDKNVIPAPTQGEHQTAENITPPEPTPETQGELAYRESTLPIYESKVNEESAMVLYNPEKKDLVDLTTTEQDSEDDDDLDKQPLSKRFKIMHPITSKPQPSRDSSKGKAFGTTSSKFSHTPLREPTSPRDELKGKGIATEEPLKDIMPFIEE